MPSFVLVRCGRVLSVPNMQRFHTARLRNSSAPSSRLATSEYERCLDVRAGVLSHLRQGRAFLIPAALALRLALRLAFLATHPCKDTGTRFAAAEGLGAMAPAAIAVAGLTASYIAACQGYVRHLDHNNVDPARLVSRRPFLGKCVHCVCSVLWTWANILSMYNLGQCGRSAWHRSATRRCLLPHQTTRGVEFWCSSSGDHARCPYGNRGVQLVAEVQGRGK